MRGLTDFLITVHVMKGLVGRGPALVALGFILAMPVCLLAVLVNQLCPTRMWAFTWRLIVTVFKRFD